MADNKASKTKRSRYDKAVINLLTSYGEAMEDFGRASTGSARGMEHTMRMAEQAARDTLDALLGRKSTLSELCQVPPLRHSKTAHVGLDRVEPGDAPARARKHRQRH